MNKRSGEFAGRETVASRRYAERGGIQSVKSGAARGEMTGVGDDRPYDSTAVAGGWSVTSRGSPLFVATNEAQFRVPPERVFEVLSDSKAYGHRVVGSDTIRDADSHWPGVGSRFHHRVGVGPLTVNDHTEVLELDAPSRLVLRAHSAARHRDRQAAGGPRRWRMSRDDDRGRPAGKNRVTSRHSA